MYIFTPSPPHLLSNSAPTRKPTLKTKLADLEVFADKRGRLADAPDLADLEDKADGRQTMFSGHEVSGFECLALHHLVNK